MSHERDLTIRLLRQALGLLDAGQPTVARQELEHLVEKLEAANAAEVTIGHDGRPAGWGSPEWFQAREAERAGGDPA